ncbi:hypothetical protein L6452_39321 [Arctium lappa]|uniref:Uncharacterized protein n=1 Tax=Arctium lappa TaxID=4217 RepID=A0ACB8XSV9_ARCLA|nr:hypothetical protein L6452_39321 [Arctium lappa]
MVRPRAHKHQRAWQRERDLRDIELNELRQLVQQLQQHLERMESSRHNRNGSKIPNDDDEETNPFHGDHHLVSSDVEALHQNRTRIDTCSRRAFDLKAEIPISSQPIRPSSNKGSKSLPINGTAAGPS